MAAGKPVAAICHGPSVLINAKVLSGKTLTCWPSIAVDVKNAGGRYVDRPVVEDGNLITSRKVDDLPGVQRRHHPSARGASRDSAVSPRAAMCGCRSTASCSRAYAAVISTP